MSGERETRSDHNQDTASWGTWAVPHGQVRLAVPETAVLVAPVPVAALVDAVAVIVTTPEAPAAH